MKLLFVLLAIFVSALKADMRLLVNDIDEIFKHSINTEKSQNKWRDPESVKRALENPIPPVALFHGLGQACNNPDDHYQDWMDHIKPLVNNTYLACLESGANFTGTILTSVHEQGNIACDLIKSDPHYANGLSIIGGSNGGAIIRYILQKCNLPMKIYNVVSVGGPQAGASKLPGCTVAKSALEKKLCSWLNTFLDGIEYTTLAQTFIGPSNYYRVPGMENEYETRTLMAELNNEGPVKNPEYVAKIKSLNNFVLIKWLQDEIIYPFESEWFGTYDTDGVQHKVT